VPEPATVPSVSVVVAARNEGHFIDRCVRSLLASDYPRDLLEVVVVDGMSSDGTADTVRRIAGEDGRLRLVENPRRITPAAFNLGIRASAGEVVFILGGHATDLLIALCREAGADAYLSGHGATDYQDEDEFRAAGIRLVYTDFRHPTYPQAFGPFELGMSIVDLLANCGPSSAAVLGIGGAGGAVAASG